MTKKNTTHEQSIPCGISYGRATIAGLDIDFLHKIINGKSYTKVTKALARVELAKRS